MFWKKNRGRERWYYDSCALDYDKEIYGEMTSKKNPIVPVVSHLSLGEAYGNCHRKGRPQEEAFLSLMRIVGSKIEIVGNDVADKILNEVRTTFPRLSITDSVHLATAIIAKCSIFRTMDDDFDLDAGEVAKLAANHSVPNFKIRKLS